MANELLDEGGVKRIARGTTGREEECTNNEHRATNKSTKGGDASQWAA